MGPLGMLVLREREPSLRTALPPGSEMCFLRFSLTLREKKKKGIKVETRRLHTHTLSFQLKKHEKLWQHPATVPTWSQGEALGSKFPLPREEGVSSPATAPTGLRTSV